ncbi:hypothetical protein LENED_011118 [Lentinula edodes]|uniref:Uncharacterized protein n=1 Tax=Lentinula edodes TaxID=5353 RepID=A0A1Q3EP63_LENED|nr:hypothetical protein LENED_011118 [Lentinula edodes]
MEWEKSARMEVERQQAEIDALVSSSANLASHSFSLNSGTNPASASTPPPEIPDLVAAITPIYHMCQPQHS